MKRNDKEFYELVEQFVRDLKRLPTRHKSAEKVGKSDPLAKHYVFQNGNVNELFDAYMAGYEYAKSLNRLGGLPE